MERKAKKGYYNETTNTAAGIPTPPDKENVGPFDPLNEVVEGIMDNIRIAFDDGEDRNRDSKSSNRKRST